MTPFHHGLLVGAIVVIAIAVGVMAAGPWIASHLIRQLFDDMRMPDSDPPQDDTQ